MGHFQMATGIGQTRTCHVISEASLAKIRRCHAEPPLLLQTSQLQTQPSPPWQQPFKGNGLTPCPSTRRSRRGQKMFTECTGTPKVLNCVIWWRGKKKKKATKFPLKLVMQWCLKKRKRKKKAFCSAKFPTILISLSFEPFNWQCQMQFVFCSRANALK